MKKIFGIDIIDDGGTSEDIDILGTLVSSEDKDTLYKDTMKFFEKLYGESTDSYDTMDSVTTDDSETAEVGDDYTYDEETIDDSYEE